jgi:hypothetical protein
MPRRKIPLNTVTIPQWEPGFQDPGCNTHDLLRKAYFELLRTFPQVDDSIRYVSGSHKLPIIPVIGFGYATGPDPSFVVMTPEQQQAASRLFMAMVGALDEAYYKGQNDGRALLAQLARGELAIGEFENMPVETLSDVVSKRRVDALSEWLDGEIQDEKRYTIPQFTCPAIDSVLANLEVIEELLKKLDDESMDEVFVRLRDIPRSMESLRTANETLRLCAKAWKNLCQNTLQKVKDL